ncbi:MAG: ferric reductase-like transmembrane domain-containing protein [Candidatus Micrarchaeia archaeon]|jgi:sulfoxide reductase heme-binding subunit YedZ
MLPSTGTEYLQKNARKLVYAIAFIIACATFVAFSKNGNATLDTANAFGFLAFSAISLALAASPVRALFPAWKYNAAYYRARRALGVSGFVFAFLHYFIQPFLFYKGDVAFFLSAAGEAGTWLWVGVAALAMLFLLAATSTDYAVRKMGKRWFTLQKLTYLVYPIIILHASQIGFDFGRGLNAYSGSFFAIAASTLLLEAARAYVSFSKPRRKAEPSAMTPAASPPAQGAKPPAGAPPQV